MNIVIKLLIIVTLLSGCQAVFDECDPADLLPYSKSEIPYETHCNDKCCEFIVDTETETCFEMWCFRDCKWSMNHSYCY